MPEGHHTFYRPGGAAWTRVSPLVILYRAGLLWVFTGHLAVFTGPGLADLSIYIQCFVGLHLNHLPRLCCCLDSSYHTSWLLFSILVHIQMECKIITVRTNLFNNYHKT